MGTSISKYLQKRILFLTLNIAFGFSFSIVHHSSFGKSLAFYSVNNIIEKRRSSSSVQQNNNIIKAKSSDSDTGERGSDSIIKWIENLWQSAFGPEQDDNNSDRERNASRANSNGESTKKAYLENPEPGSKKSGIGMVSGWACDAETVEVEIDGNYAVEVTYGVTRTDTASECGDTNNGFTGLMNWNLLDRSKSEHTARLLIDGEEFSRSTFTVTTLGQEFLTDVSGEVTLDNFPTSGNNVRFKIT